MSDMENSNTQSSTHESTNIVYLWKIPIDRDFVKSIISILRVVAAFLSLIAFICVASGRSEGCDDDYASTYNFFEFMAISTFLTLIIMWLFFAVTLHTRLFFKIVPWKFGFLIGTAVIFVLYIIANTYLADDDDVCCQLGGYLIGTAVIIVLYLIANICLAAQDCGKGSNQAGAAFGFFVMFTLMADAFLTFREWKSNREESSNTATASKSPDYNPDKNMEQY